MRFTSTILTVVGIIVFFVTLVRAADRLQRFRGWTLGLALITLGTLVSLVQETTPVLQGAQTFVSGVFLIGFSAATAYCASKAAIPCMFHRHPGRVANKIAAVTEDGEVVSLDVQWAPEAIGDRELLLQHLLRHGHVVETRCASCGNLVPRHTGA